MVVVMLASLGALDQSARDNRQSSFGSDVRDGTRLRLWLIGLSPTRAIHQLEQIATIR
jgi:hypothetical protein